MNSKGMGPRTWKRESKAKSFSGLNLLLYLGLVVLCGHQVSLLGSLQKEFGGKYRKDHLYFLKLTCGSLLHGAPFFPVVLASFFFTSLACTLSKKSFLHWLCFTCSTRTQILLGRILPEVNFKGYTPGMGNSSKNSPPTRLLTTTPTARLETLKTRPVLPW